MCDANEIKELENAGFMLSPDEGLTQYTYRIKVKAGAGLRGRFRFYAQVQGNIKKIMVTMTGAFVSKATWKDNWVTIYSKDFEAGQYIECTLLTKPIA
jgi:phosphodiesterase/alkaline phosphatase D-like protein